MIRTEGVTFEYIRRDEEGNVEAITKALDDVSIHIKKGEFVAILGSNGSGKSTFAKHLNALLVPEEGHVIVNGLIPRMTNIILISGRAAEWFSRTLIIR